MIISSDGKNKFAIRNWEDLSVIKIFELNFGDYLCCGLCFPDQKLVVLGMFTNLVELNFEKMEITKSCNTKDYKNYFKCIEKVNDDILLTGGPEG